MTSIGYATLQIIPSLEGVSASIDKQLGGKLQVAGKKGGRDFAKAVAVGVQSQEAAVRSAANKVADATGKIRVAEQRLQELRESGRAKLSQVAAAEERLSTARRGHRTATSLAADAEKSLADANRNTGDTTESLGGVLDGLTSKLGGAGTGIAGLAGAAAGLAGAAAFGAIIAAGVQVTKTLYDIGSQFDDMADNITIKTGAVGVDLDKMTASVENIAKATPSSIGDIGSAVAETSRSLHLSGQDLEDFSKSLVTLNRLTGNDTDVQTLGRAFRLLGVGAGDQVGALNDLFHVSQHTGLSIDDLSASLAKGGPALKEAGLSFGQSAGLLSTLEKAGVDTDKVLPGLTKSLALFAKGGKDGPTALRDTITELKNLKAAGNEPGALDLANKVFGPKGGLAFLNAIDTAHLDLDSLNQSLDQTGLSILDTATQTDDFAQKWEQFKNTIEVAAQPLASGIFDGINSGLGNLLDSLNAHQPEIIGFFTDLASAVVTGVSTAVRSMGLFLESIGQLAGGVGNVVGLINQTGEAMANLTGDTERAKVFHDAAQGAFGWGEGLEHAGQGLQAAADGIDKLKPGIKAAGDAAQDTAQFVQDVGDKVELLPDNKTIVFKDNTDAIGANLDLTKYKIENLPDGRISIVPLTDDATQQMNAWRRSQETAPPPAIPVTADTKPAQAVIDSFKSQLTGQPTAVPQLTPSGPPPKNLTDLILPPAPRAGRATGGPVFGAGTATSDSIPAMLSNGEHVWTAAEVAAVGGQGAMYRLRSLVRGFAGGGQIRTGAVIVPEERLGKQSKILPGGGMPDHLPGNGGTIGLPDWSTPGQKFGAPPSDWWLKPINPEDILFPDVVDPGKRQQQEEIWAKLHPKIKAYATGGAVGGPSAAGINEAARIGTGSAYQYGGVGNPGFDCSGAQSDVYAAFTGKPTGVRYFTTESNFEALGFIKGTSPGAYNIGIHPGGGGKLSHMAGTLPNGVHFESGGAHNSTLYGGSAAGADSAGLELHYYLPVGGGGDDPNAATAAVAAAPSATGGGGSSGGGGESASSGGGGGLSLASSFSGLAGSGLSGIGKGVGTTGSGSDLSLFGNAAATAVSGQVSSALGVLGINDAPPILKAASQLIGGIKKVGGGSGPLSAGSSASGALLPDEAHGLRSGQQPGPAGPTYNITARDTEDAFVRAQRLEREKSAAKLARF